MSVGGGTRRSLRVWPAGLGQSHEEELEAAGDTKLVIYPKKIILDSVLAQSQALSYFTIGESFGQAANHVHFPLGKQTQTICINCAHYRRRCQCLHRKRHLLTVGPDLSLVYASDALGESLY